jgi:hypothetical protein
MGRACVRRAALAVTGLLRLTACSAGKDGVAQGGSFEFVSPGGQTEIFYATPPTRAVWRRI